MSGLELIGMHLLIMLLAGVPPPLKMQKIKPDGSTTTQEPLHHAAAELQTQNFQLAAISNRP